MARVSWSLSDGTSTYLFPVNPNQHKGLYLDVEVSAQRTCAPGGPFLTTEAPTKAKEMQFSGIALDEAQVEAFGDWLAKRTRLLLTDHLGRQWTVLLKGFDPQPQRGVQYPWRHVYTMTALLLSNPVEIPSASPGAVLPTSSTFVFSTTTPVAGQPVTLTVTLFDAAHTPVTGKTISVTSSGSATVASASSGSNVTDSTGVASFTITDLVAQTITLTVVDVTDSSLGLGSASLTISPGPVSATNSTIAATPSSVVADGASTTTVLVTLRDVYNNAVRGKTVALHGSGSAVVTPASVATDTNGHASFTASDASIETVTFTATDVDDARPISGSASVTYTGSSRVADASRSTLTASAGSAAAGGSVTLTATLLDATGVAVVGKNVTLAATMTSTLGDTAEETSWDNSGSGFLVGNVRQATVSGTVTRIRLKVKGGASSYAFRPVVYAATSLTAPSSLIVVGSLTTIAVSQAIGWVWVTVPSFNVTAGSYYWIGIQTDSAGGGGSFAFGTSGATNVYAPAGTFGSPPSTWPGGGGTASGNYDFYAEVISSGSASMPSGAVSDSSGRAVFSVSDASIETLTFAATDTSDSVAIAQTATVSWVSSASSIVPWAPSGPSSATGWTANSGPIVADAFTGATLDRNLYGYGEGLAGSGDWDPGSNNYETGGYRRDGSGVTVNTADGLHFDAVPVTSFSLSGRTVSWRTGGIKTYKPLSTDPGWTALQGFDFNPSIATFVFEMKAWFDPNYAYQFPAFWGYLMTGAWPPEIDFFEMLVGNNPPPGDRGRPRGTIHAGTTSGADDLQTLIYQTGSSDPKWATGWHTFTFQVGPTGAYGFIDGVQVGSSTNATMLSKLNAWFCVVLNMSVVGASGGSAPASLQNKIRYWACWRQGSGGVNGGGGSFLGMASGTVAPTGP